MLLLESPCLHMICCRARATLCLSTCTALRNAHEDAALDNREVGVMAELLTCRPAQSADNSRREAMPAPVLVPCRFGASTIRVMNLLPSMTAWPADACAGIHACVGGKTLLHVKDSAGIFKEEDARCCADTTSLHSAPQANGQCT